MSKNNLNKFSRRLFIKSGLVGLSTPLLSKSFDLKLDKVEPPLSTSDKDWKSIRSHFIIDKNISYMNNASLGMPPLSVVQSINKGYQSISKEPLHGKHDLQNHISEFVIPQLANTFGVGSKEIVLTRNASEALDIQAHSINLKRGDEILISSQEHPAGLRPWLVRQKNDGIKLKKVFIPSPLISVSDTLSRISDAITSKTKAISFCHVTRGGHLYPVKEIVKMAKNRNLLTLIDGAQAAGQFPINLKEIGCDAYSVSLHKWILAPAGTGFLYINNEAKERVTSPFVHENEPELPGFNPPGTKDFPVRAAIGTALDYINAIGLLKIEKRCRSLSNYLKAGLSKIDSITILSSPNDHLSA
ncbi:MAG: aminotransferase class V-fold PLP-dependent enzyme, partial [Candidatus Marinimicrobia bacterium]|nr:aminotransferase class V-fold PLP-dependent enzyme [Candidatus Neomarinimicrobiota bacterium]